MCCLLISFSALSQNTIDVNAVFDIENKSISITQTIQYKNTSNTTLNSIYLNDWSNSYSEKDTPLAERFADEFKNTFHFAKDEDRGFTTIQSITQNSTALNYKRLEKQIDVIKVELDQPLAPNSSYILQLKYTVQIPNDKFTRYGITSDNDVNLRYWYITPAIYTTDWQHFSNKNLDDAFIPLANLNWRITIPKTHTLISELNTISNQDNGNTKTITLSGKQRKNTKLLLKTESKYKTIETDFFEVLSDIDDEGLDRTEKAIATDKVAQFITNELGDYPHKTLLITEIDYKKDPIYGINQLPDFIRPFPSTFQYELKILKTGLLNYLENTLLINPRKEHWLLDGIQVYYLMKYVDTYYPNMKLLGNLSNVFGIRSFHAADLDFNDQYGFMFMHMARTNLDQPLTMAKDSLLKFNKNIANKYKAGVGLKYLESYINSNVIEETISEYLAQYKLKETTPKDFKTLLESKTNKDLEWFFSEYLQTNKRIDYKIKKIKKTEDSLTVTLKNLHNNTMPISLFSVKDDSIYSKRWVTGFTNEKTITIPRDEGNKLVLNYDNTIPEFNNRNNWKSLRGFLFNNKPLQFRLFKDIEDPNYNQVFFMPEFDYNFYDGFSPGLKLYNKTVLSKRFLYNFSPKYAIKSKQLIGSGSVQYNFRPQNQDLYRTRIGVAGQYANYAPDLSFTKFTPFINFSFRNPDDLRDNKKRFLNARFTRIARDEDITGEFNTEDEPNYSVFNVSYGEQNPNLKNYFGWNTDLQLAKNFGKAAFTFEFRKLTENNRQYNVRLFAGTFLYNSTYQNSDYFSFALDRPTDYLFDYNYLGRSEDTGVLSQQYIVAEGGFKSKLSTPFANQWITTINTSTTIWRYIMAYGDVGFVNNHGSTPNFVYDSGIRLNLVEDYFELYLPVYSNLGWEIGQPNYDQKIRFVITLSPKTLLKLFTRRWY